jgi:glycosyltransferase involved in cell wall biosynthesis
MLTVEPRRPKVSVYLVTYNHEPYIGKAVESVLGQRAAFDFEVIVGEDGSTDHTRRLLEALQDRYPQGLTLLPSSAKLGGPWGSFQYSSFVGPSNSITC